MDLQKENINELWAASNDELITLIGLNAIQLERSPSDILRLGRGGAFANNVTVMGFAYESTELKEVGRSFLKRWQDEIRAAICGNRHLMKQERTTALNEMHLLVNSVVVALTTHITVLAPFSGLLLIVAVMLVRSGLAAYCNEEPAAHLPKEEVAGTKHGRKQKLAATAATTSTRKSARGRKE